MQHLQRPPAGGENIDSYHHQYKPEINESISKSIGCDGANRILKSQGMSPNALLKARSSLPIQLPGHTFPLNAILQLAARNSLRGSGTNKKSVFILDFNKD
jgi:hypothetical protein